jgi:hypothetical protein
MDAAFDFSARPAAGARIIRVSGDGRAWLAADARVAAVIEIEQRNAVVRAGLPYVAHGPVSKRTELAHDNAAGQGEVGDLFEGGAAAGLLAAEAGEPDLIVGDGGEERLDLTESTTAIRRDLVKQAVLELLFGDGAGRLGEW